MFDGVVHLVEHVYFAPFQFSNRFLGRGLQILSRGGAAAAARRMKKLYFHNSVCPTRYVFKRRKDRAFTNRARFVRTIGN